MQNGFIVLDFGSQVTQLIARRLRELNYYCEILPYHFSVDEIKSKKPKGIILSGGPNSVYDQNAPLKEIKELVDICPVMGICYGMQLIAHQLGGEVQASEMREYGMNQIQWSPQAPSDLRQLGRQKVWMSHGDVVKKVPLNSEVIATSESGHPAALLSERFFAVQFHPEVIHTDNGAVILNYFAKHICQATNSWTSQQILKDLQQKTIEKVKKDDHVLVALSGGVDSSVVATFLTKILGPERVHCVFVNNGLLRKNEYQQVLNDYKNFGLNVLAVDAEKEFLSELKGISDPEMKRKIIGRVFIEVFEKALLRDEIKRHSIQWLAQGTLYPDVIESVSSHGGPSQTIKSHHNVGGLPERMKLSLLEPVRELFKDEVRLLGKELGLPEHLIGRHPFPGPGLAIRIMGDIDSESLRILRDADDVYISFLREKNLYHKIWQAFCVLLPTKTVGVMGDGRTYEKVLAIRAVTSTDGMTADWFDFDSSSLREISKRITNQVKGVNRVVYDITSKPPGTIEWE